MQYPSVICEDLAEPLTTLHGNLELLQDEYVELMESERFHDILRDIDEITRIFRELQKEQTLPAY